MKDVLTMGTPHDGSYFADCLISLTCADSDFLPFTSFSVELRAVDVLLGPIPVTVAMWPG